MIEDINGFANLIKIDGRSFQQLKERMITDVRVPASIVQFGESSGGFPWVILKTSVIEKGKRNEPVPPVPPTVKTE